MNHKVQVPLIWRAAALLLTLPLSASAAKYDVAAYVWPAYHNEPRWKELGLFADGEGEWQNLYESVKRTPGDYQGVMVFVFENGKVAKVELSAYATKSNRRKLTGAYSDKSPLKAAFLLREENQIVLYSTDGRALIFSTAQLLSRNSRDTGGNYVLSLKRNALIHRAALLQESEIVNQSRYRAKALPAAGALLKEEDLGFPSIALG